MVCVKKINLTPASRLQFRGRPSLFFFFFSFLCSKTGAVGKEFSKYVGVPVDGLDEPYERAGGRDAEGDRATRRSTFGKETFVVALFPSATCSQSFPSRPFALLPTFLVPEALVPLVPLPRKTGCLNLWPIRSKRSATLSATLRASSTPHGTRVRLPSCLASLSPSFDVGHRSERDGRVRRVARSRVV